MALSGVPTFAGLWRDAVAEAGDRPFLVFESSTGAESGWTYAEFDALVRRVAGGLRAAGVTGGGAVHVTLANSPAFVAVWLATVGLGARLVPSDPQATAAEIALQLRRTRPAAAIGSTRRADVHRQACDGQPLVRFAVDEDDTALAALTGPETAGPVPAVRWADLPEPEPLDPAAVMFTSGTTSTPKGVVVTQANYAFTGAVMAAAAEVGPTDRLLVALPLFHANAQYYSFAAAISARATVALLSSFSASRFLAQAARHRATHASLFAAPMRMILARGAERRADLRLRHVWYAQNVTRRQYEELAELFGCRPRQLYGMTETIPAVLTSPPDPAEPASIGRPTPGCRVTLGPAGEVLVGGRRGVELFLGYLDDEETTRRSFADGWFHTGDLAHRDGDGNYVFAGRRGDVLKVAGENVSLAEVEAALAEHPAVFEAAVVGRPDPVRDEVPVAYVVADAAQPTPTVEELAAWCATRLSPVKRPRDIIFVASLPRTSVGKIRKFLLGRKPDASGGIR